MTDLQKPDERVERITVTIDDDHLAEIQTVAVALQNVGMNVGQVLATIGIITGDAPAAKIDELKQVAGVVDVEPDQPMQAL